MALELQSFIQWFQEQQEAAYFLPVTLSLLIFFSFFFFFWFNMPSPKSPPSPPRLPIIGNFHQLGELLHRSFRDLSIKYGPLMLLHLGSVPTLVVSSPEMAKEITKTHDLVFASRPATTGAKLLLYGSTDMGFAPSGEYWKEVRKLSAMELLSTKRLHSFKFIREEEVKVFIQKITHSCSTNGPINITEMLLILANNLISRVAFGDTYDEADGRSRLGHLTRDVLTLLGAFSVRDFIPWLGWIDILSGLNGRMKKTSKAMDAFFDQVIEDHLKRGDAIHSDEEDLVDILLRVQRDKTLNISLVRDNIKAIILDMFIAGTDTLSIIVEWAMVHLMRNPEMMKKAQEEVRREAGNKSIVEEEDIHHMDYIKCIVKEILRLHPPAPLLIPRESTEMCNVGGFPIPAKTRVFVNAWAIQRDPTSWGENAEEFIPERFLNNPIDPKGVNYEYLPFGAGRRGCPGASLGLITSEYVLANLLFWFDWEFPVGSGREDVDMTEAFGLTVYKKNPTYVMPKLH